MKLKFAHSNVMLTMFALSICIAGCKKEKSDTGEQSDAIAFASCAEVKEVVHSIDKQFTYQATLLAITEATGTLTLSISSADGSNTQTLKTQGISLGKGATHDFSYNGQIFSNLVSYSPKELKVRLQFTKSGSTTAANVTGQSCTNPTTIITKDTLYGRAQGLFVNAGYDSVPRTFTMGFGGNEETPVSNLAGNTFSAYTDAPSGSNAYIDPFTSINIAPDSKFTFFRTLEYYSSGAPTLRTVIVTDNLNQTDVSKAYVRYVNVYDADAKMSLKRDGNSIALLSGVDFLKYTSFVPVNPGVSTFTFVVDFANATVGTLQGVNLEAGKYYTIYQGGYDNPGFSSVRLMPKVITHN